MSSAALASGSYAERGDHQHDDARNHRHRRHHHHHHRSHHDSTQSGNKRKRSPNAPAEPAILPFQAQRLTKYDLEAWKPVFASYLDIQKQLYLEDLTEDEIRGRWKSFVGKWNLGQLAEGWYDPATKRKAVESYAYDNADGDVVPASSSKDARPDKATRHTTHHDDNDDDVDDEDEYGPDLPSTRGTPGASRSIARPSAPNFSELALRADQRTEDEEVRREAMQNARKADRLEQRARLEEIAPRAEPGTKERQLEKKQEKASAVREFRDAKGGAGDIQEVADSELMGEGGGTDDMKRMKKEMEKKKSEREERKLEILRARAVERDERLQAHKEKEEKTMEMLKAIAKERFG